MGEAKRSLKPLGLFYWGAKWTLASWCIKRNDYRSFRVDRISEIEVKDEQFDLKENMNLDNYVSIAKKHQSKKY